MTRARAVGSTMGLVLYLQFCGPCNWIQGETPKALGNLGHRYASGIVAKPHRNPENSCRRPLEASHETDGLPGAASLAPPSIQWPSGSSPAWGPVAESPASANSRPRHMLGNTLYSRTSLGSAYEVSTRRLQGILYSCVGLSLLLSTAI